MSDARRQQWETLQREASEVAAFLAEYRRHFGKPAAVRVTRENGETLVCTGAWHGC